MDDVVTAVKVDYAVSLLTETGAELRIAARLFLDAGTPPVREMDPEAPDKSLLIVLRLLHQPIRRCLVTEDSILEVQAGNVTIRVFGDDNYESSMLAGPDGYNAVCAPGGELVVWARNRA